MTGDGSGGELPSAEGVGAAFFDLDRTLMEGSSAFQFGKAAYRHGLLGRRQLAADAWANLRFRVRGSNDGDTEALRDRISAALAGVRVRDLERLGGDVLAGVLPRIERQVLEIAYGHQDAGRPVFIVTAAAQELAVMLAHVLALDGALGSVFSEARDGVYTGVPGGVFMYEEGKATAIRELAAERGFDLAESYAYSDSASDLPMLEVVGHAVVVNPDQALLATAHERGWEVLTVDHLGRVLRVAGLLAATAAAGGVGALALVHRARHPDLWSEAFERARGDRRRPGRRRRPRRITIPRLP